MNSSTRRPGALCVFCGSKSGNNPAFEQAGKDLGEHLARAGVTLVYGAGSTGIMGAIADATLSSGGHAIGVVPDFLVQREVTHNSLSERIVVPDMHTRKAEMFALADAFCVLPGGIGTLEEVFEIATWKQLHRHRKPMVLLNIAGCWNALLQMMDDIITNGFADPSCRELITVVERVADVLPAVERELSR